MDPEPVADEAASVAWWNALPECTRGFWMAQGGDTGRVVDAWAAYKRARREIACPISE